MANAGDENGVVLLVELIERKIARCTVRNHQFAESVVDSTAKMGMLLQRLDRTSYAGDRNARAVWCLLQQEIDNTGQVIKGCAAIDYLRHWTGLGRCAGLPATRASRYLCTS